MKSNHIQWLNFKLTLLERLKSVHVNRGRICLWIWKAFLSLKRLLDRGLRLVRHVQIQVGLVKRMSHCIFHHIWILRGKRYFLNLLFKLYLLLFVYSECRDNALEIIFDHFYMHWFGLIIFNIYFDIESFRHIVEAYSSVFASKESQKMLHYLVNEIFHMFWNQLLIVWDLWVFKFLKDVIGFILNLVLDNIHDVRGE